MRHALSIGLVVGIAALAVPCVGQECEVGGLICEDTRWDPNECPDGYVVTSSIVIACDATLTILPGTLVRVRHGLGLSVGQQMLGGGTLVARGTAQSPIRFTSNDPYEDPNDPNYPPSPAEPGDWVRIDFTDYAIDAEYDPNSGEYVSGCVLEHVIIEYAGADSTPAARATSCSPYLAYCEVRDNAHQGISVDASGAGDVKITHCAVHDNGEHGIGVNASAGGAVEIEYCQVHDHPNGRGIAVTASGTWPARIENCEIARCSVNGHGAGIYLTGGADHIVRSNLVNECAATGSDHCGGGMYVNARTTLDFNAVSGCAAEHGGGITLWSDSDGSRLRCNEVAANTAVGGHYNGVGGGIYVRGSADSALANNVVTANTTAGGYDGWGGAICVHTSDNCQLTENTVTANTTVRDLGHAAGIYVRSTQNCTVSNNIITDNTTVGQGANGAGVYLKYSANCVLSENTISANHASGTGTDGGGVYLLDSGNCSVTRNTVMENTCRDDGGGLYLNGSPSCELESNTISQNTCGDAGGAILFSQSADCVMQNNSVTGNTANGAGAALWFWNSGNCAMTNCVIIGNRATDGNIAGIYVGGPSPNMSFAGDPNCATYNTISCCPGAYAIYNDNPYDDSGIYDIDARYNIWCTDDSQAIQDGIYDFFDNASKAFVYFHPFCERIPGDVNGDWCVDLADLAQLLANYGMPSGAEYEDGDLDADGDVDLADLAILLAHYRECCPPCP